MPMSWELTEAFNILINNHKSSANIASVMSFIKLVRAFLWEQHVFFSCYFSHAKRSSSEHLFIETHSEVV